MQVLDLLGLGNSEENQLQTASGRIPPSPGSTSAVAPPQQPVVLPDLMDGWGEPEGTDSVQVILLDQVCPNLLDLQLVVVHVNVFKKLLL